MPTHSKITEANALETHLKRVYKCQQTFYCNDVCAFNQLVSDLAESNMDQEELAN